MKATIDLPDDLYRQIKSRCALEGRPIRSVAIDLFQSWLRIGSGGTPPPDEDAILNGDLAKYPWLAISRKYIKPSINPDLEFFRASIARGWAAEAAEEAVGERIHRS